VLPLMDAPPVFDPRATTIPVLRYLVALDDHRHFGRAAAAARVSQPTLSALIAQWEKRMACVVFERDARGVRPTPVGERVIAAARQALAALEAVEGLAAEAKPPFFGPVRLGVIPTVGPYALPFITAALASHFPDLEVSIREATTADLLLALDHGRVDVVLLALLPGLTDRYGHERLYDEPFLVALPKGHRLAAQTRISAADLIRERLLLLDDGHCLRDQALAVCQRLEEPTRGLDYRATSLETLRHIVASGAGVTLLPALAARAAETHLEIRPMEGDPVRSIGFLWRTADPRAGTYPLLAGPVRRHLPKQEIHLR